MSLSSTRTPFRPRTRAAAEVPILMRLPDLRLPSGPPQAAVATTPPAMPPDRPLAAGNAPPVAPSPTPATAAEPPQPTPAVGCEPAASHQAQPNLYALLGAHVARYLQRFKHAPSNPAKELPDNKAVEHAPDDLGIGLQSAETLPTSEPTSGQTPPAREMTSASPPPSDEHQLRLADRRQKARERQRRLQAETPQRSWWTSHAPMIAVGFFAALVLTIYVARSNRHQRMADQAALEAEVPKLSIEPGPPSVESPTQESPAGAVDVAGAIAAPETPSPTLDRSPPLLAAKPQVQPAQTPAETDSPAETTEDSAVQYPATDSTMYRPGGRAPRTAPSSEPAPNYPSTSAPQIWR